MILIIDIATGCLVADMDSDAVLPVLILTQGDDVDLSLRFVEPTGQADAPWSVVPMPAPFEAAALTIRDELDLSTPLLEAEDFEAEGEDETLLYTAALSISGDALDASLPAASKIKRQLRCLLDIRLEKTDHSARQTLVRQWPVTIRRSIT